MPVLTLTLLTVAFLVAFFILLRMIGNNRAPSKKKRHEEVETIKADLETWTPKLVKIGHEELDLFSLSQSRQVLKTGAGTTAKGTFTTIFQEPILSYSYKRYLGRQVNELLYAKSADHEYIYWTEGDKTTLEIDGQAVGELRGRTLYGARTGQPLGSIAEKATNNYLPIQVGGREIGRLSTEPPAEEQSLKQKALEFIPPDLDQKEEQLLLALITQRLVMQSIPSK